MKIYLLLLVSMFFQVMEIQAQTPEERLEELGITVGEDLTLEEGYEAARLSGIKIISTLKAAVGDLSKIKQFVRVHGMVNSAPDFYDQPKVINGFSDLMVEVFGEKGKHARAAVGQVSLPFNMAVEIEVTVEVED